MERVSLTVVSTMTLLSVFGSVVVSGSSSLSMTTSDNIREIPRIQAEVGKTANIAITADWTPTPQPGLSREATERDRSLTVEQFRALNAFPDELQVLFGCIAFHESRWQTDAVGDGGRAHGVWQVHPRWWGEVPPDLAGQAEQAAEIASEHGSGPWTTARRCQ